MSMTHFFSKFLAILALQWSFTLYIQNLETITKFETLAVLSKNEFGFELSDGLFYEAAPAILENYDFGDKIQVKKSYGKLDPKSLQIITS
jgi:hypothetical protein